ncbi:hypothetical protein BDV12DRAFT_200164 [Aspergillus spectabilis]
MGLGRKQSGSFSIELGALTSTRIACIREPGKTAKGTLVETQTSIVGIEWLLEGETSGRLFGYRAPGMQSVALPPDLVITGIILSLGSASAKSTTGRTVYGLGLLCPDSSSQPQIKLGRWTEDDIVHVFRAASVQPNTTIIGIVGQYTETDITKFGILTANLIDKTTAAITSAATNIDIYTRWHYNNIPPPNETLYVRHGITGLSFQNLSPLNPPIIENPAIYVNLKDRQLASVHAFFPLGAKKEFGGFRFTFTNGDCHLVGSEENHESIHQAETVTFDLERRELITKIICYFDSNVTKMTPSRFHGVEFCTSKSRKLGLGWLDAYSEDYRRDAYVRRGEKVVGLHFGIRAPVIESIGLIGA